jgi:hypothetical protein
VTSGFKYDLAFSFLGQDEPITSRQLAEHCLKFFLDRIEAKWRDDQRR